MVSNLIGAAVSAAATAVAATPRQSPSSSTFSAAPRRLNERKVPDFWEDKPDFWFRIFDAHLSHFAPSEMRCFDALLPLLTPAARATVHSLIRSPGRNPYTKARQVLLRHFGRTPHQMAREFRETWSLGDMLPSELMDHLQSLLPDITALYEVMLLDSLPSNARDAALQHSGLAAMAAAADQVILGNRALAAASPSVSSVVAVDPVVSAPCYLDDLTPTVSAVAQPAPPRRQQQQGARKSDLCAVHAKFGKRAYKCAAPSSCRMQHIICPRPSTPSSSASAASGNGKAGGQ